MGSTEKLYDNVEYQNNMGALVELIKRNNGATLKETLMLLILSQLTRTADALEDISSKLGELNEPL